MSMTMFTSIGCDLPLEKKLFSANTVRNLRRKKGDHCHISGSEKGVVFVFKLVKHRRSLGVFLSPGYVGM